MGQLVFQATAGGQVALVGPNPSTSFSINVPAVNSTLATLAAQTFVGTQTLTTLNSPAATALTIQSAGNTAITIDASQNVGIGTTTPSTQLHLVAPTGQDAQFRMTGSTTNNGTVQFYNATTGALADIYSDNTKNLVFRTNGVTEAMRINSSGNLLVGTTTVRNSGIVSIDFNGNAAGGMGINDANSVNGSVYIGFLSGGTFRGAITNVSNTAVAYNTTSDYRLKENIAPMIGALAKVQSLKPCTYTWKNNNSSGQGFIAHELQAVVPDCVTGEKDAVDAEGKPQYQGIDVSFLVATLTAAIQEQQALIESLTTRLTELEAK